MFRSPFLSITFEQINQRADRLTETRRYRGRAGSSFPFLPRRSALIPSRTLVHGSPWLRASEATRVRRRQINGLERLGRAIGVLIGVLEFALGKIGVLEFAAIGIAQPSWASIGANGRMHDFPHYPIEVLNRAAGVFMMA